MVHGVILRIISYFILQSGAKPVEANLRSATILAILTSITLSNFQYRNIVKIMLCIKKLKIH